MNLTCTVSAMPSNDNCDQRLRRILFRCWHRGTQEADLMLGRFAENVLSGFGRAQLDRFEALLECSDTDLFDWITGRLLPPPVHDHDVMRMLRLTHHHPARG